MASTVTPVITGALDCVVAQLIAEGRPVSEGCLVVGQPVADGCDCGDGVTQGRAWARLVDAAFSESEISRCPMGAWELAVEVGVWRCVTAHNGECDLSTSDAEQVDADMASLVQAVSCCSAVAANPWAPRRAEILGPSGGCVGVSFSFTVQVNRLFKAGV